MKRTISQFFITLTILLISSTALFAGGDGKKFDMTSVLTHHLMDDVVFEVPLFAGEKVRAGDKRYDETPTIGGLLKMRRYTFRDNEGLYRYTGSFQMHLTKRVMMMFTVSIILIIFFAIAAALIKKNPLRVNGHFAGIVETLIQFFRNDVMAPNMHGHGKGFEPFILSLFFFILFNNLFGLIPPPGEWIETISHMVSGHAPAHGQPGDLVSPIVGFWSGITVTGDIAVTAALSLLVVIMIWVTGFKNQGPSFLWSFLPYKNMALPIQVMMWVVIFPILFVLEIIVGPLAKGFALTIRLLANMTAGHVIILALMGFIFNFGAGLIPVIVPGAGAIYVLEIFVGFLQAYIFALLTTIFIGSVMHAH